MLFITEADLRDQFKLQPITKVKLPPDTKLTPGARQFLLDRGVDLYDEDQNNDSFKSKRQKVQNKEDKGLKISSRLSSKIKLLHSETLLCATNFIGGDINIIQDISKVSRFVLGILKYIECGIMTENLEYKICDKISEDNFSKELSECLEINDFYIQVENGKDIITLHRLRMLYVNFYEELEDYQFESEDVKTKLKEYLCQTINTLSRLIYTIHGSKQCQRF